MKVGVLGAGAVGTMLGGRLAASGVDVVLVGRGGDAFRERGLTISDHVGRVEHLPPSGLVYAAVPDALADRDVVLVTVKRSATESAVRSLADVVGPKTVLVPFQNGVGTAEDVRKGFPAARVLRGMIPFNVVLSGPERVHQATRGALAIERPHAASSGDGTAKRRVESELRAVTDGLASAFRSAGLPVKTPRDIEAIQWSKLVLNLNNAVNALAGVPLVVELSDRTFRRVLAAAMDEAIAATSRAGIRLAWISGIHPHLVPTILRSPDAVFRFVARSMLAIDADARSSMLDDLDKRRLTEIDYLAGEVVSLGARTGVPTPVNASLVRLVHEAEAKASGSPRMTSDELVSAALVRT
ncbi:MAG: 2-dehydropantoate 2-reductase [Polyangiaceae bacterium]